jgi:ATP-dependent DNA ligase
MKQGAQVSPAEAGEAGLGHLTFGQLESAPIIDCRRDRDVILYVFDLLELNGRVSDRFRLRSARRGSRVSSRPRQGIKLSEHIDAVFRHACKPRAHRLQSARLFEI